MYDKIKYRLHVLFGKEYSTFISYMKKPYPKYFRVNTLKISVSKFKKTVNWDIEPLKWYREGFSIYDKDIGNSIEHKLGYIYIQDASSMIPPLVLSPNENDSVLDLCAAPGSKTTQIACMMNNNGSIIANDKDYKRICALSANLQRCGVMNTATTIMRGEMFWKYGLKFNKILLDAPCSATGAIISNSRILETWSIKLTLSMSRLQKQLITSAKKCLDDNGIIVYSTCSLEPEENEEVIDFAIKNLNLKPVKIKLKNINYREALLSWQGKKYNSKVKYCIRIYPHDNHSEGFFICKLRHG